jgi:hypothetical protein
MAHKKETLNGKKDAAGRSVRARACEKGAPNARRELGQARQNR